MQDNKKLEHRIMGRIDTREQPVKMSNCITCDPL